ncbi:IS1 family transposase [Yersinia ruckeri]|uniref:IS1 family transposase n=1 Tax=Yersinia ruckeri TaxID=29486 RepID=UPI0008FD1BCD|nr:hypothetical protein NJ56_07645 [Yersinia ruckeri]EKN3346144.1 hypothetical protein [Yersinia ruckeri]EKN3362345.1 hypothetical protein [Yersinia ruckeri]EKN4199769.1 hypothetical protein [Yersinia ruckeri]EKN4202024.1 hypothetical protein [Yersinia ruckeri]
MPKDNHRISKTFTQRIERNNLALRTRIKRLWPEKQSASHARLKSHEKVIGNFIKKHMFYSLESLPLRCYLYTLIRGGHLVFI